MVILSSGDSMVIRTLGSVLHITPSRLIVVKISKPNEVPPLHCEVIDANNELIGHVIDVIGPVEAPFAVIKPVKLSALSFVKPSTVLFYRCKARKARRKHRRRQRRK